MSISQIKQAESRTNMDTQKTAMELEIQRLQEYADGRDICIDMLIQRCDQKEAELVKEKLKAKIMSIMAATLTSLSLLYALFNYLGI